MLDQKVLIMIAIALLAIQILLKLKNMSEGFKSEPNVFASNEKRDDQPRKVTFADSEVKDAQDKMWSNGGVFAGMTINPEKRFQTKIACSCSGYGVPRDASENMPFNDDSNIYNSKLMSKQFEDK